MARNNHNVSYTPDVFDEPPEGPVGVHRGNPAWYAVILPYFVAIIIALLAGLLVWAIGSGEISHLPLPWNNSHQSSKSTTIIKKSHTDKSDGKDEDKSDDADTDEDEDASAKQKSNKDKSADDTKDADSKSDSTTSVDKSATVKVINATNIAGYAAKNADKLKQSGYANVTAGNPSGKVPSESVVWYKDDSQKAAAQDIAKTLGITAVENEKEIVSQIVVVLCK